MELRQNLALIALLLLRVCYVGAQESDLRRAAQLDAEQKCDEAGDIYKQVLARDQASQAVLNNVGNHYLACGQPQRAAPYFAEVLRINPAHANANLQLARLAVEHGEGLKALQYLSRVQEKSVLARILRAEALHWAGKHSAAVATLDAVQHDASNDPAMLFLFGRACARVGLYDRAEAAFNSIVVQNPLDFESLLELGRTAALAQHYDRAESALTTALNLHSDDADVLFELARVYSARQDYRRSVYVLAKANQLSPKRPDILLALARAAQSAGFYGDSAVAYDDYLQVRPLDDAARRDRALVYGLTGTRSKKAFQELRWYIYRHPSDAVAYYNLAQLTWKTKPEAALDHLSTALRLKPDFAAARYSEGWLLHRMGRDAEAVTDLQAVARTLPNVSVLTSLASAYLALDRPSDAEKVLRQALAISPEDPEALMHLGRALMGLGREEEAQHFLTEFQRVRPKKIRAPLLEPRMIELATLSPTEMANREIDRLRQDSLANPGDAELQFDLAKVLLANCRMEDAQGAFRHLLTMNADSLVLKEAGTALLQSGEYELAKEFLQRAVPDRPETRIDLATALFFTGELAQAQSVLDGVPQSQQAGDYFLIKARILDAIGHSDAARKVLTEGLHHSTSRPQIALQAVVLLVQDNLNADALDLIKQALNNNPGNSELMLTEAILLGLLHQDASAANTLKEIESRWPEWDRPYLVHGLLLEQDANREGAKHELEITRALGSRDIASLCALARIENPTVADSKCACLTGIRDLIVPSCGKP